MKYLLGIPYVNRPDLLKLAVNSVRIFWSHALIVDNSDNRTLRTITDLPPEVPVYEPSVPLTFSQTMNLLFSLAHDQCCDVIMLMHNDGEAQPGTPEELLSILESLIRNNPNWGVVFTNYDTLAAFNMGAVKKVGKWDTTLPQYFADNDYYRRMNLAGYEIVCTDLPVTHHNTSSTIKSDATKLHLNTITFPLYKRYYQKKWGGEPGREVYKTPFHS